jgi:pimeloyl-ACP methyl ester carboxylesterase
VTAPLPSEAASTPHWTGIDWRPFVKNLLVNDQRIRYLDYGSGRPLVLLHGMAASWQWWLENISTLAARHRIIAVDLPGFGHSEPLPPPAEMATHARTVIDLLRQLDVRSATIVGHSMGGLVAMEMALADRERVRGLVLVGAGGVPMTERRLTITLIVLRIFSVILGLRFVRRALATKPLLRRVVLRGGFRDPRVLSPELAAEIMPLFSGPGFVDAVAAAGRAVRRTVPESITCPVLLVWGEHDAMAPLRCAQDMQDRLRDSKLVVVPGAGHSPMIECPNRFNEAILAFTAVRQG